MIAEIIKTLKTNDFYKCGKYTEIAKGKNQLVYDFKGFKRKIKRKYYERDRNCN